MERRAKRDRSEDENNLIEFEQDLHAAMRWEGWVLPETESEVAAAESCVEQVHLPAELADARVVLRRASDHPQTESVLSKQSADIEENLARAAREGGEIPPEIEKRMKLDRQAAEQKQSEGND